MKIRNGFVSNSSTTTFVLNDSTHDLDDFNRRFQLFMECGMMCGFVDNLWDNKIREMECYLDNGILHISGDSIPTPIARNPDLYKTSIKFLSKQLK